MVPNSPLTPDVHQQSWKFSKRIIIWVGDFNLIRSSSFSALASHYSRLIHSKNGRFFDFIWFAFVELCLHLGLFEWREYFFGSLNKQWDEEEVIQICCLHTPCHTRGHVCYVVCAGEENAVFSGDTLFIAGCGKFFEGCLLEFIWNSQENYLNLDSTQCSITYRGSKN